MPSSDPGIEVPVPEAPSGVEPGGGLSQTSLPSREIEVPVPEAPPGVEPGGGLSYASSGLEVPVPDVPPGTKPGGRLRRVALNPKPPGRLPFLAGLPTGLQILVSVLILGGAVILALYFLGEFDPDPPAPPAAGAWDACGKGDLVSAITVSTDTGVARIIEEDGPLGRSPWLEYPELSWDLGYDDLYEYGPRGSALEARLTGPPGTAVCFRIEGEPGHRRAELVDTAEVANTSMQWVLILADAADAVLNRLWTEYPNAEFQALVPEDGQIFARWRGGGNGTSATYSLVRLEILVEWERTLEAG